MKKIEKLSIIPAISGARVVYCHDDKTLTVGEVVIAFIVDVSIYPEMDRLNSSVTPVGIGGEPASNYFGILFPDGRVETQDIMFESFEIAENEFMQGLYNR
jgi:hypothetical protein